MRKALTAGWLVQPSSSSGRGSGQGCSGPGPADGPQPMARSCPAAVLSLSKAHARAFALLASGRSTPVAMTVLRPRVRSHRPLREVPRRPNDLQLWGLLRSSPGLGQAALKCRYLTIMSLDPTGPGRERWSHRWKAALNAFDITFDGRLSAGHK
jgi:hypothetical protein